jgi:hypothetical protein
MKKEDRFLKLFKIKRHEEKGIISFSIDCPFGDCTHSDESTVHYGEEEAAKNGTIGKMSVHCRKEHNDAIESLL